MTRKKDKRVQKRRKTDKIAKIADTITDYALVNYSKLIEELETKLKLLDWINIKDKIPEDNQYVDIFCQVSFATDYTKEIYKRFISVKYIQDKEHFELENGNIILVKDITHWRLMPENPI